MQVGEPVSAPPIFAVPPDTELAGELVSVTFKSRVKASHAKTTIAGPHWERGQEGQIEDDWQGAAKKMRLPPEPYSKRAAVYLVKGAGGSHDVEVKVRITKSKNVSGDAKLIGRLRCLSIEGTCPTAAGEHTVTAHIIDPPEEIQSYRGKIGWALSVESAGFGLILGTTLAEVYFILGSPTLPYQPTGVWSEVLRFLCGRVGVTGEKDANALTTRITVYCHSGHGLRYDTRKGRTRFGLSNRGGTFNLKDYISKERRICNCYDQAAAVQALSGAVGVEVTWLYLRPFGFIRPTNLVGVGECNNPFFRSNRSDKLVAPDSPERTGFDNHAFVGDVNGKIFDACAKPHLGTETTSEYLADSIDDTPSLYGGGFQSGRLLNIVPKRGVVDVD